MSDALWSPTIAQINDAQISAFIVKLNQKFQLNIKDYPALYSWSIKNPATFWESVAQFGEINFTAPYTQVLKPAARMIDTRWFVGAELNFAQHLLRHQNNKTAIISYDERGKRSTYTHAELYLAVAQCAQGLKELGVKQNDVVAGLLPNIPETIIAMLATTSLGAIWTACSPDFGEAGVLDRFAQVKPKVLIATDGYTFKDKEISCIATVQALQQHLLGLTHTVFVPFLNPEEKLPHIWQQLLNNAAQTLDFVQLPFNHPVYILYSSGTTGVPKCIVHGAGGTLLQHLKELMLHTDLRSTDTLFYYTTCGWMMWHWMTSGLALGATLLLYEGAPLYPNADRLWDVIAKEKVSIFGTSAKYISALDKAGYIPASHDLSALRVMLSTGSPLLAQDFEYVYRAIKTDLRLSSISGGTDIISCFALGCPIMPVYQGELQCIGLGMQVEIYNELGEPVQEEKGELVCTAPFPSMPIYFWNDPKDARYLHSYFEQYKNIWAHGDFAKTTAHGGLIIYGRSDAVLKPGGVRIGTAEIYRPVEKIPEVLESLAIGQPWEDDIRIVLFVVLQPGNMLTPDLRQKIVAAIRSEASPRHVPSIIIEVQDLPRTKNGKLAELAVRQVVMGEPVENTQALANPECLSQFADLKQLT